MNKFNICIMNSSIYSLGERIFLDNHIRTFEPVCNQIFVVTGNFPNRYSDKVHIIEIETSKNHTRKRSMFRRITYYLVAEPKLTFNLIRLSKNFDIVFFDIGEYLNVLPTLCSKLLGKKTVVYHRGGNKFLERKLEYRSGLQRLIPLIEIILLRSCYLLADCILCESPSIIKFGDLERYRHKIIIFGGNYIDTERFQPKVNLAEKEDLVGYTGRLTYQKGIINFVRAIPLVLQQRPHTRFIIAGEGEQRREIENEIEAMGVKDKVSLSPWVPDDELANYLNRIKLFVLPSYAEGIPSILREAMASGTIVLATPVGGIPDVVKDGQTGFILEDNSPQCISRNILRALDCPHLDKIARDARALIEKESSFEVTVERYKSILTKL